MCGSPDGAAAAALADAAIPALAEKLGLESEFAAAGGPPAQSIAFLRRHAATPGAIADDDLLHADAVVHVAAPTAQPVGDFCAEAARLLGPLAHLRVLGGVVRPKTYTGAAMNNFAYAHAVVQQPGRLMPNAFLVPMSKTAAWWAKDWMERHTYFLPRYDDDGRMTSEGHALASAAGIPCLLRRTYKSTAEPAPDGRLRLRHVLRVRRRRRADLPPGLRQPARRGPESGVEVRARGADVARPPGRHLARSVLEAARA